jgi:hypothetical protein
MRNVVYSRSRYIVNIFPAPPASLPVYCQLLTPRIVNLSPIRLSTKRCN